MKLPQEITDDVCTVLYAPQAPHVAQPVHLAVRLSAERARDMAATHVFFRAADGSETERAAFAPSSDRAHPGAMESAAVSLVAPEAVGDAGWSALLVHEDAEGTETIDHIAAFALPVAGHPVAVTVWDVPSAVEAGADFTFSVGLKCTCGCSSAAWEFVIRDAAGRNLARGRVGDVPLAGTSGLCHAAITMAAPEVPGQQIWQVTARPPDHTLPHACGTAPIRIDARPAPEVTLRVEAYDAATGAPVDRAKVVAHPYRTFTGSDGVALLRVPAGPYRIYVSGKSYFASQTQETVDKDLTIRAALFVDREFSDADQWA